MDSFPGGYDILLGLRFLDPEPFYTPRENAVDGRNPAPVDMVNIPLFTRFYTSKRWLSPDF